MPFLEKHGRNYPPSAPNPLPILETEGIPVVSGSPFSLKKAFG
jgi:hypothetical protein